MLSNNPFSILSETIPPIAMQSFIVAMVILIAVGTIVQMIGTNGYTRKYKEDGRFIVTLLLYIKRSERI